MLLHETSLIEAFNLKFAIEYKMKEMTGANEALADMPPRLEEELDPVTLHNQALVGIESNPTDGFAKLQYLLSQQPFPPETFANLLLLYCKYEVGKGLERITLVSITVLRLGGRCPGRARSFDL